MKDLESVTRAIEELLFTKGRVQKEYTDKITRLEIEEKKRIAEIDNELKAAEVIQGQLLGDSLSIETESFEIYRKQFNPKSKVSWVITQDAKQKERMLKHLKESNIGLIKTKVTDSLILNDFKDLVAEGAFRTTGEGLVIDENGETVPGITAELKPDEIKYKVKGAK